MKKGQKNRGKCQAKYQSYMGMLRALFSITYRGERCYENVQKEKMTYVFVFFLSLIFNTKAPKHIVFCVMFLYPSG